MSEITSGARSSWEGRRVLITGLGGFTGRQLAWELDRLGADLTGIDRIEPVSRLPGVYHRMDIQDGPNLAALVERVRPEVIFHLAALLRSDNPSAFYTVNAGGTAILFESICKSGLRPRVVLLSSSAVYGPSAGEKPIEETAPLRPESHYALSKLAQEWIAAHFRDEFGIPVVICRPFNLSGPGLPVALALSAFARQIACAEASGRRAVRVGRLNHRRDFVDVRDAVAAYLALAETGEPGAAYNVCSGISRSMSDCLDILLHHARTEIHVEQDPGRSQVGDVDNQTGDPARLKRVTGWEPVIPFERSLLDMLEYWRLRDDACS